MVNPNISDKLFVAVEEYNRIITDPKKAFKEKKLSDDEKRGMFYTCLRREFPDLFSAPRYGRLRITVDDISCSFKENGEICTIHITRYVPQSSAWEGNDPNAVILNQIKWLVDRLIPIYPTKVLNEMALIVNSIN